MIYPIRLPRDANGAAVTSQGVTFTFPLPSRTGSTVSSGALAEEHALNV